MRRLLPLLVAVVVTAGACSIEDGGGEGRPTVTETETSTTSSPPESTTTLPASVGIVEVAGTAYEIDAECYAPGAGELVAIGIAQPVDGPRVEVYLQAFVGQPYVGITVIDDSATTLYEPAVDRPLEVTVLDDVVRADDIALVTDLDLDTGEGVDAGTGTVVVECRSYAEELPPGFADG